MAEGAQVGVEEDMPAARDDFAADLDAIGIMDDGAESMLISMEEGAPEGEGAVVAEVVGRAMVLERGRPCR